MARQLFALRLDEVIRVDVSHPPIRPSARIICLEGPSAVGKTTLASKLAREMGAAVVGELEAGDAPPIPQSAGWFVDRHAAKCKRATELAETAPLVVLDGDPFKGLWYNWVFAHEGWPGVDAVAPLYHERVKRGSLRFPDLYVLLRATEQELRERRASDLTRARRNFETHLCLVAPQQRYFAALAEAAPQRVLFLDAGDTNALAHAVVMTAESLPAAALDSPRLLARMVAWIESQGPGQ